MNNKIDPNSIALAKSVKVQNVQNQMLQAFLNINGTEVSLNYINPTSFNLDAWKEVSVFLFYLLQYLYFKTTQQFPRAGEVLAYSTNGKQMNGYRIKEIDHVYDFNSGKYVYSIDIMKIHY